MFSVQERVAESRFRRGGQEQWPKQVDFCPERTILCDFQKWPILCPAGRFMVWDSALKASRQGGENAFPRPLATDSCTRIELCGSGPSRPGAQRPFWVPGREERGGDRARERCNRPLKQPSTSLSGKREKKKNKSYLYRWRTECFPHSHPAGPTTTPQTTTIINNQIILIRHNSGPAQRSGQLLVSENRLRLWCARAMEFLCAAGQSDHSSLPAFERTREQAEGAG